MPARPAGPPAPTGSWDTRGKSPVCSVESTAGKWELAFRTRHGARAWGGELWTAASCSARSPGGGTSERLPEGHGLRGKAAAGQKQRARPRVPLSLPRLLPRGEDRVSPGCQPDRGPAGGLGPHTGRPPLGGAGGAEPAWSRQAGPSGVCLEGPHRALSWWAAGRCVGRCGTSRHLSLSPTSPCLPPHLRVPVGEGQGSRKLRSVSHSRGPSPVSPPPARQGPACR